MQLLACSSLQGVESRSSRLHSRKFRESRIENRESSLDVLGSRRESDRQLTFEPYCTYEMTPGFKPFIIIINVNNNMLLKFRVRRNN